MSECATHAVCEAGVWPHDFDERAAGRRLLARGAQAGMLLLWDRGFHSFEMVRAVLASGAHLLGRLPATVKPRPVRTLADGTKLVLIRRRRPPSEEERLRGERTSVMVRLVRYTLEDPDRPGHRMEHRLGSPRCSIAQAPPHGIWSSPTTLAGSSNSPWTR
jgi:hypothetical protein